MKRLMIISLLMVLALLGMAACEGGEGVTVSIQTDPVQVVEDETLGTQISAYSGDDPLTFTWQPVEVEGVSPEALSYMVALVQMNTEDENVDIFSEEGMVTRKVAHHWASNPNGLTFTMGAFGFGEAICFGCPSYIIVAPETVEAVYDEDTGITQYEYTIIEDQTLYQISPLFLLVSSRGSGFIQDE
jgi:hypothetical protein